MIMGKDKKANGPKISFFKKNKKINNNNIWSKILNTREYLIPPSPSC